jgi:CHAT domain-containing protein/tetratricopeptide (TPR) repeat protein
MVLRASLFVIAFAALLFANASPFGDALTLQRQGKSREARDRIRAAASDFRASGDRANEAKALSMASKLSVSLGDYRTAISEAETAVGIRRALKDDTAIGEDYNTLGLANLYLGSYATALSNYQEALKLDREHGSAEGEIARENNIGNVFYFQGRYSEAFRWYQTAMDKINTTSAETWTPRRRQLTIANLAALYQRIGKEQAALNLYRELSQSPQAMPVSEYAQLLLNQGILYRRLGDPVKALDLYTQAQTLFARERHRDGEISALRSVGLDRAVDLNDLPGALQAFTAALRLAQDSSNTRGIVQSKLYRAEALRRLGRLGGAESDATGAFDGARTAGLIEEEWEARYTLGKLAEEKGDLETARNDFQEAIAVIESVRSALQLAMRNDFLADKREVYDSIIALRLRESDTTARELFSWIERSRARTLVDRVRPASQPALADIQSSLAPDTVLIELWMGSSTAATLWLTRSSAGVVQYPAPPSDALSRFVRSLENSSDAEWKDLSRSLGNQLLAGVPLLRHIIVAPDGPLGAIPFEVVAEPGSGTLLIENHDVSYVPSAQFLRRKNGSTSQWLLPWRTQLAAFGDPPVAAMDAFATAERWQQLEASADEVNGIAQLLPGRSRIYLGAEARKRYLMSQNLEGVPLVHLSTHAVVDTENPDRSRILLAPDSPNGPLDYLFEAEVYDLDLKGVDLVTISACDTARGKLTRGEGIEAFSRAFLAAGSSATVTSLWRVPDRPTADFMKQLYYYIARGEPKSEALRLAKLKFLKSNTALAQPRYWAGFVLNGDGWNASRRAIPWSAIAGAAAILLALAGMALSMRKSVPHNRRGDHFVNTATR